MTTLTGAGPLLRLALRRDRLLLPVWVLFPAVIPVVFVAAFTTAFPSPEALREYAETSVHNTAFTVTYGALHGSSLGELIAWRAGFLPVMIGLFTLLTVLRHTRSEEEAGLRELIGATVVSRHANLIAALLLTSAASLAIGLLSALAMISQGLGAAGSLAYGLGLAGAGCVFAAIGAVTAQLTTGAGAARGIGIVILGGAFLLRGVGDVSASAGGGLGWLSWLSPVGWPGQLRAFSGERWWVLALFALAVLALTALALALSQRRDLGSGLFAPRTGPAGAATGLRSPFALAWRLHRGALAGRAAGFAVVGFGLGAIAEAIGELMNNSTPAARAVLARIGGPGPVIDQYQAGLMTMLGVVAAGLAIHTALRARAEERSGRADPLLAGPVHRLRWAAGHLVFALLGPLLWLALFGAALGLAHGLNTGEPGHELPRSLTAALVQLPAVWLFAALAFALFGCLPRLAGGAFAVLLASLLMGWLGGELKLSQWVLDLSVFEHIPRLPGGAVSAAPLLVLTALAAALGLLGLLGLRRRDLALG
ncbi:ABC transporter permease [Crossiella sp. CA198]|uniref:ABC transporter permease n=1 Tax=Crossiella sp. CA198 TaxID=3455607 RepID=UPI003F8D2172